MTSVACGDPPLGRVRAHIVGGAFLLGECAFAVVQVGLGGMLATPGEVQRDDTPAADADTNPIFSASSRALTRSGPVRPAVASHHSRGGQYRDHARRVHIAVRVSSGNRRTGTVRSSVFSARHAGVKSGGMGTEQEWLVAAMVAQAQEQGMALTGAGGLLKQLTKAVLETALNTEMTEHLGHAKHAGQPDREGTNVRDGSRTKTVVSDAVGEVEIAVPAGSGR